MIKRSSPKEKSKSGVIQLLLGAVTSDRREEVRLKTKFDFSLQRSYLQYFFLKFYSYQPYSLQLIYSRDVIYKVKV